MLTNRTVWVAIYVFFYFECVPPLYAEGISMREVASYEQLINSDNYRFPETLVGTLTSNPRFWSKLIFKDKTLSFPVDVTTMQYLPVTGLARYLLVSGGIAIKDPESENCLFRYYLLDLKRPNPYELVAFDDACFDGSSLSPEFYHEGEKVVVQFTSSISHFGSRQPNVKYTYQDGKITAEIRDPKTRKVTTKEKQFQEIFQVTSNGNGVNVERYKEQEIKKNADGNRIIYK